MLQSYRDFKVTPAPLFHLVTSWEVKTMNIGLWVMHAVCFSDRDS